MDKFDVIIVGAGTAGCVLANRLSQERKNRVLVIEAGGSDKAAAVRIPAAFTQLFQTKRDYAYWTEPQTELAGRRLFWPRGKMLGGCSSMNAQLWLRGMREDYQDWAASAGPRWHPDHVMRAYSKTERRCDPHYGQAGPMHIEDQRDPSPSSAAFLSACADVGIPRVADLNAPHSGACGMAPVTQHRGQRWSAVDAYLRGALARPNLQLVRCGSVRRILFQGQTAVGVEYEGHSGKRTRAYAREIVVCAGTVGTPQLLLLSGIGDGAELEKHGIARVADSPEVGQNLQDHLLTCLVVRSKRPISLVGAQHPRQLLRYLLARRGMLTSPVAEGIAFVRSHERRDLPDVELVWAPAPFIDHGLVPQREHGFTLGVVVLRPHSRGRLWLQGLDPSSAPSIDPRYLSDSRGQDLQTLCAGLSLAQTILKEPALAAFVGEGIEPAKALRTPDALSEFVRQQAETIYHPIGTCRMGEDAGSVVDAELRVRGVSGLWVMDASVMPNLIRGHTQAPTMMLAELGAETLLHVLRGSTERSRQAAASG